MASAEGWRCGAELKGHHPRASGTSVVSRVREAEGLGV
jgi:hypothetical protein